MIKKKNGLFLFLCSLIPGAGEMYLGFMKEGTSIMGGFFALSALFVLTDFGFGLFIFPLIWFYSFFNTHNKASLSDEEFYALEDDYLFHMDRLIPEGHLNGRQSVIFGWLLILMGISILWRPVINGVFTLIRTYVSAELANMVKYALYQMPKYVIAVVFIFCGIRMISNKKKELEKKEI